MKVLVIEKEKDVAQQVTEMLNNIDDSIQVVGVTGDIDSTVKWLTSNRVPDLILASPDLFAARHAAITHDVRTVVKFSTNSKEFQFAAYRYKTIREILAGNHQEEKPVTFENYWTQPEPGHHAQRKERFLVKQGQRLLSIAVADIAYFFSQDRFIFFRTFDNQKYLLEYRIEQLEGLLHPDQFFRINRSYVISLRTVREIHAYFGNRLKLYLSPEADKEVIVSRKRVAGFKAWLGK